jgi:cell wall-associated NlpC family hydrolase
MAAMSHTRSPHRSGGDPTLVKAASATAAVVLALVVFIAAATVVITAVASTLFNPVGGWHPATSGGTQADPRSGSWPAGTAANQGALGDIPTSYLGLYRQASLTCPGLSWTVLAGIGKVESDHGRSPLPGVSSGANSAGAQGPMQFLPATFAQYNQPIPPGGANPPSPFDPADAIYAAARMLCHHGAAHNTNLAGAILAYNHSTAYLNQVLAQAHRYQTSPPTGATPAPPQSGQTPTTVAPTAPNVPAPTGAVSAAVWFARAQIGQRYVWGGNGGADGGFDCSGLTKAAYAAAGITIPRTAQTQFNAGPKLPPNTPIQSGDLVFFGTGPGAVTHVGLAISGTEMIDAPDIGTLVRTDPITRSSLIGITRPTTATGPTGE